MLNDCFAGLDIETGKARKKMMLEPSYPIYLKVLPNQMNMEVGNGADLCCLLANICFAVHRC